MIIIEMYDNLEMVLSSMTKLFFLNLLYSVSTVMITITPVDIVMEPITLQCNILLLHLYLISFLCLYYYMMNGTY